MSNRQANARLGVNLPDHSMQGTSLGLQRVLRAARFVLDPLFDLLPKLRLIALHRAVFPFDAAIGGQHGGITL